MVSGYEYTPSVWPILASAAFMLLLAALLWRRREVRGAIPLSILAILVAGLCLAIGAETAATGADARQLWFLVRDALVLPTGIVILWFTVEYASFERYLTRPLIAGLVGSVLLHLVLYLPEGGRLLWSRVWWAGEERGELAPLGVAFTAYTFAVFVLATAILVVLFVRSPAHRAPVALILVAHVAVRIVYPLTVLKIADLPNAANVLVLDFAALMYATALLRFRLFDLVPVARQTILERIPDAMLVLDAENRVVDVNAAAERLLDLRRPWDGREPAETTLARFPELAQCVGQPDQASAEASFEAAGTSRTCLVTSTPLADWQGRPIGRLVLLHDVSEFRQLQVQLVDRERALAAAQERERLARELHDGLAQDLWLAKLKTTRLASQPGLDLEARALTDEITAAVDAGIAEAREAVAAMRRPAEENGRLRELLTRSLEDFEDRFGLPVEFECDAALPALSARAEAETLRIMQEALTNVRRHADATVVRARAAAADGGRLVLEVRDNGCGFEAGAVGDAAYGLAGMRERAALIGGEIQIESAPQEGTCVRMFVPCATEAAVAAGVA
jgi:signal transduction histidine kinase